MYKPQEYISSVAQYARHGIDYLSSLKGKAKMGAIVGLAALVLATSGCNTMAGFGKDLRLTGDAIHEGTKPDNNQR